MAEGDKGMTLNLENIVDMVLSLVPSAEGWPDWMGPKIDPNEFSPERAGGKAFRVDGRVMNVDNAEEARGAAQDYLRITASYAAIARFIESEQAATSDEEQRIEEQAKALANMVHDDPWKWDNTDERSRENYRDAIRAGVTVPESEK